MSAGWARTASEKGQKMIPKLREALFERRRDGDAVEHGVHGHAGEDLLLVEGDSQAFVGPADLGIHLVQVLEFLAWPGAA